MAVEGTERFLALNLAAGRIAIGTGLWAAPRLVTRVLGFPEPDETALAVSRIAATRDLVLGVLQLAALGDRKRLATMTAAVAVCDAGDAAAFALALRDPATRTAGLRGVAMAAPATVVGAWLAARLRD